MINSLDLYDGFGDRWDSYALNDFYNWEETAIDSPLTVTEQPLHPSIILRIYNNKATLLYPNTPEKTPCIDEPSVPSREKASSANTSSNEFSNFPISSSWESQIAHPVVLEDREYQPEKSIGNISISARKKRVIKTSLPTPKRTPNRKKATTILPNASKSPVIDALIFCALNNMGASILRNEARTIELKVDSWKILLENCEKNTRKQNPTTNQISRIKTLRRWFDGIPHHDLRPCTIQVKQNSPDDKVSKIRLIIEKLGSAKRKY